MSTNKVINFSPGPAKLPEEVLKQAQSDMLSFNNTGMSVMELSHRGADFSKILNTAEKNLRELMSIPDNYHVLFLQGGGTGLMAATAMNLIGRKSGRTADYIVTGAWSASAAKEAQKYGDVKMVIPKTSKYTDIPDRNTWELNPEASYLYYCANETVHGVEFQFTPETQDVPIVCDMSSNIMSRPVDVSKFGLIFAGAQKNIGCAGVTMAIIRQDLIDFALPITPSVLNFKDLVGMNSLLNTPPTWSIYIMGLVFQWLKEQGGSEAMEERSVAKATLLYETIDQSGGFYTCPVLSHCRSRMNAPFRIQAGNEDLEKKFIEEAQKRKMCQLKGHRSVGGIRASIYNAVSIEDVQTLVEFMKEFQTNNQ